MINDSLRKFEYIRRENKEIQSIGKTLGRGTFGVVRELTINNKIFAGKLILKNKGQKSEEEKYGIILRGLNIININKIIPSRIGLNDYDLVIMEKAALRDLGKINEVLHHHNLLKIIYNPFDEVLGDNLLRFYSKQIINALELLDKNYYVHNDIKPENILITYNLIVKLTDFSLLRKVQNNETKIAGGTPGYVSPEYYIDKEVKSEVARKQDYFSLGSTLYFVKYGEQMLKYKKFSDNNEILYTDEIVKLLEKKRDNIKSGKSSDREFINFLCSLIGFKPEDRPFFEEIYRNIWLNNNLVQINNIQSINYEDEDKMIIELQKSDFLIKKEKEIENYINSDYENKKKIIENRNIKKDIIKKTKNKLCRFRFKKKK